LAAYILFERCYTVLLHSNLDFSYGWFDRLLASTRFHHWHHDSGEKGRNRNFAGMFSIFDTLFGTLPPDHPAARVVWTGELAPRKYWRQFGVSVLCVRIRLVLLHPPHDKKHSPRRKPFNGI